jgi:hypothetical protein
MLRIYRCLLYLYPAGHREQFGGEMTAVLRDLQAGTAHEGIAARSILFLRETRGLVIGALQQHARLLIGPDCPQFPTRRFTLRTEFRFPKTTAVLMTIILAGILVAIRKAEGIEASLSTPSAPTLVTNLLPGVVIGLASFYAAGLLVWSILFAMRRSGIHRLDDMSIEQK